MSDNSSIEWTDASWNPIRGCNRISPGCQHCYAERFAERFRGEKGHAFEQGFDLRLVPEKLAEPLKWGTPKKVFVNSMSDLFHKDVPEAYIRQVCEVMRMADWHTFQVLTKRSERMRDLLNGSLSEFAGLSNVWWGVSVEDRRFGLPRIGHLRQVRGAKMRWLSIEPLLEDLGRFSLKDMGWVVVGGESGPGARPMDADWVRRIQVQCDDQGVSFFFKQWGGVFKKKTGRELDGQTYDNYPEVIVKEVPIRRIRLQLLEEFANEAS
jgi:protein gp37